MSKYRPASFSTDDQTEELLGALQKSSEFEGLSRSDIIRQAISKLQEGSTPMHKMNRTQIAKMNKAQDVVAKFFDQVARASEHDWMEYRKMAGELVQHYAAVKHCSQNAPAAMDIAKAVAEESNQPDSTTSALYRVQAIRTQDEFAAFKSVLRGAA